MKYIDYLIVIFICGCVVYSTITLTRYYLPEYISEIVSLGIIVILGIRIDKLNDE